MSEVIEPSNALALIAKTDLVAVFSKKGGVDEILGRIENDARAAAAKLDASSKKGRDEITSLAFKVTRSKTALDATGKDLKAEWLAKSNAVDAERRAIRDRLDALADEVRKPVDEYKAAEAAKIKAHEDAIAAIEAMANVAGLTSEQIGERLYSVPSIEARDWYEFKTRALNATMATVNALKVALAETKAHEDAQAERAAKEAQEAEARRIAAEQARIEREARIAAEAAENARKEAEIRIERERARAEAAEAARVAAQQKAELDRVAAAERAERERLEAIDAERQRQERIRAKEEADRRAEERKKADFEAAQKAEDDRRAADNAHRAKINSEAAQAIVTEIGLSDAHAKAVIRAIVSGKVPHVGIRY